MYIVAIAWLYVAILMAATARSLTSAVLTFLFYGLFPLALFLWIMGTPHRRRLRSMRVRDEAHAPDREDAQRDQ